MNKIGVFLLTLVLFKLSFATTLVIPPQGDITGTVEYAYALDGETLQDAGIRFDMGYDEMVKANPHVDPVNLLSSNTRLLIPSRFVLPAIREGVVINLAEYRLYFFPKNDNVVMTFPVGIGRKGWSTPVGKTTVVGKQINPTWHPSAKLRANAEKKGVQIPDEFPPGEANPLGKYALRLGWPTYLIHGTNHPEGIGERISAGCIRMLAEDIEYLFSNVAVGTKVEVINYPVKFSLRVK
jgi:L,D-transpeptidase ErfK/SrfK